MVVSIKHYCAPTKATEKYGNQKNVEKTAERKHAQYIYRF